MRTYQTLWQKLMPALLTLLLMASILMTACGGGEVTTPTPAVTATSTIGSPTPNPTSTPTSTSAVQKAITIVYEANLSNVDLANTDNVMKNVIQIIKSRLNDYGITKAVVQQQGNSQILVQLRGVKDIDATMKLIGQTAKVDFRVQRLDAQGNQVLDENGNPVWDVATGTGASGQTINLEGKYFKANARVTLDQNNKPQVAFQFNSEAAPAFQEVTTKYLHKTMAVFLDGKLIFTTFVQAVIMDMGVIPLLTLDEAKMLAIQLNSGALPVPLTIVSSK